MTEAYKIQNNLDLLIMETMLEWKTISYNLRNPEEFVTQRNRTVDYGLEFLINRHSQLCAPVPGKYKQINSLN